MNGYVVKLTLEYYWENTFPGIGGVRKFLLDNVHSLDKYSMYKNVKYVDVIEKTLKSMESDFFLLFIIWQYVDYSYWKHLNSPKNP